MMTPQPHSLSVSSFSFAAGVGDASAVAERVSGQVERLVAEEMKKVTAALNGISEHTVKIDEVGGWVKLLFSIVVYIQCWAGGHGLELECSTTLDILGQLEVWQNSQCQLDPRHDHLYLRITGKKPVAMLHSQSFIIIMIMTSSTYAVHVNIFRR